jgi:hypothetical protein
MSDRYAQTEAAQGFGISVKNVRNDGFPGTILYYFEIIQLTSNQESVVDCVTRKHIY